MWPLCLFTVAYKRSRSARLETSPWTAVTLLPSWFTAASRFALTAAGDEDVGAFRNEALCRSKTDAAVASGDDCYFSFQAYPWFLLLPVLKTEVTQSRMVIRTSPSGQWYLRSDSLMPRSLMLACLTSIRP